MASEPRFQYLVKQGSVSPSVSHVAVVLPYATVCDAGLSVLGRVGCALLHGMLPSPMVHSYSEKLVAPASPVSSAGRVRGCSATYYIVLVDNEELYFCRIAASTARGNSHLAVFVTQ